jgi:hypothetical protein
MLHHVILYSYNQKHNLITYSNSIILSEHQHNIQYYIKYHLHPLNRNNSKYPHINVVIVKIEYQLFIVDNKIYCFVILVQLIIIELNSLVDIN